MGFPNLVEYSVKMFQTSLPMLDNPNKYTQSIQAVSYTHLDVYKRQPLVLYWKFSWSQFVCKLLSFQKQYNCTVCYYVSEFDFTWAPYGISG